MRLQLKAVQGDGAVQGCWRTLSRKRMSFSTLPLTLSNAPGACCSRPSALLIVPNALPSAALSHFEPLRVSEMDSQQLHDDIQFSD